MSKKHQHLAASGSIWKHLGASGSFWEHLGASGHIWEHLGVYIFLVAFYSGSLSENLLKLLGASGIIWESTFFRLLFILEVCQKICSNFWEHSGASGILHFSRCLLFWKPARKIAQTSQSIWESTFFWLPFVLEVCQTICSDFWEHLGICIFWLPFILEVCQKIYSNFWAHLGASGSIQSFKAKPESREQRK